MADLDGAMIAAAISSVPIVTFYGDDDFTCFNPQSGIGGYGGIETLARLTAQYF